jgi:hypothetical protein
LEEERDREEEKQSSTVHRKKNGRKEWTTGRMQCKFCKRAEEAVE